MNVPLPQSKNFTILDFQRMKPDETKQAIIKKILRSLNCGPLCSYSKVQEIQKEFEQLKKVFAIHLLLIFSPSLILYSVIFVLRHNVL